MSEDNNISNGEDYQEFDQQLYDKCEQFCQKLRRNNQHLYKQFSDIVIPGRKNAREHLCDLLSEDPDLLKEVNSLLEDEVKFKSQKEKIGEYYASEPNKNKAMENIIRMIQNGQIDAQSNKEYILELFDGESNLIQQFHQTFKKRNDASCSKKQTENRNYFQKLLEKNNVEYKNDLVFWDRFKNRTMQQFGAEHTQFLEEFLKLIYLYSECIITQTEFMELLHQQDSWLDREFIDEIRQMISTRIIQRRISTPFFKPLKDTDFTQSERVTRSYVKMPMGYAKANQNEDILNHIWVSVPFGSEDQSFLIMRKNTFEEQLFKSEDERFEFDVNIMQMKRTIKLLQEIVENGKEELVSKVIDMRIIQQVYRNGSQDQNEILQILQQRPIESSKVLLKRLKIKLNELQNARNSRAKSIWETVSLINFHRSLDHRSFYFKKNDKLIINGQRFVREIEEQAKNVLIKYLGSKDNIFIKRKPDQIQYFIGYLNSLQQLTNIRPYIPKQNPLPELNSKNVRNMPLLYLYLGNKQIIQECAQFVIHYLQIMGGNTLQERKIGALFLIKLVNMICLTPMQPMQINEFFLKDQELKEKIYSLEIYDMVYNSEDNGNEDIFNEICQSQLSFFPDAKITLFSTQQLYILLRFFHALYQRMEIAYNISRQNVKGQDQRYNLFKSTLYLSLKSKDFKYEDYLRGLFGKHGFIFSTLEKVLHDTAKQLIQCVQDPCTVNVLEANNEQPFDKFFQTVSGIANGDVIKIEDLKHQVYYQRDQQDEVSSLMSLHESLLIQKADKKPIYRIANQDNVFYISLLPTYGNVNYDSPTRFFNQPFLTRNLIGTSRRMKVRNCLEWIVDENCHHKPITDGEDYLKQ